MSKSNKKAKILVKLVSEIILAEKLSRLRAYLDYCEYDGKLKVFNHWEDPYPILEGVVSEIDGGFELGTVSIKGSEM